jgi:hypothetical protein
VKKLVDAWGSVYAAPSHAAELGTLRRLDQARWINWGDDLGHFPPARLVAERVPETSVVLRTSHMGTQLAPAAAGVGALLVARTRPRSAGWWRSPWRRRCAERFPRCTATRSGSWSTAPCATSHASQLSGHSWRKRREQPG